MYTMCVCFVACIAVELQYFTCDVSRSWLKAPACRQGDRLRPTYDLVPTLLLTVTVKPTGFVHWHVSLACWIDDGNIEWVGCVVCTLS